METQEPITVDDSPSPFFSYSDLLRRYEITAKTFIAMRASRGFPTPIQLGYRLFRWERAAVIAWEKSQSNNGERNATTTTT